MKLEFYRCRRAKLLRFVRFLRVRMATTQDADCTRSDARNILSLRYEMSILRREYHGGEMLAWAPMTYTPRPGTFADPTFGENRRAAPQLYQQKKVS